LPRAAARIAAKHDAKLVNYTEPRGERRHWFTCQNFGAPFTWNTAKAVLAELRDAGLIPRDETDD
jgi:hypothetical protein